MVGKLRAIHRLQNSECDGSSKEMKRVKTEKQK